MDHILPRISTSNASGTLLIISWLPVDHEILGFRINVAHKKGRTSKSIRGGGGGGGGGGGVINEVCICR